MTHDLHEWRPVVREVMELLDAEGIHVEPERPRVAWSMTPWQWEIYKAYYAMWQRNIANPDHPYHWVSEVDDDFDFYDWIGLTRMELSGILDG